MKKNLKTEPIGAFAFKELYQVLFAVTGAEFIPTYANRGDGILSFCSMNYLDSPNGRIETILTSYLWRDNGINIETSVVDLIRNEREQCKQRLTLSKVTTSRLDNHIRRLKSYERKIFAQVLSKGLNDALRRQGTRATDLIRKYEWLRRLFTDFESVLQNDFTYINERYQQAVRNFFGDRLRQARTAAGLSQMKLGESLGLKQHAISNWEQGLREPNLATLVEISRKLSRPVTWFLGVE